MEQEKRPASPGQKSSRHPSASDHRKKSVAEEQETVVSATSSAEPAKDSVTDSPEGKKKRTKMSPLRRILFLLCLAVFLISAGKIIFDLFRGYQIKEEGHKIVEQYVKKPTPQAKPEEYKIDFDNLLKNNADTVGWLYIPDTSINYPVVYRENDNDYYLHRSFGGEYSPTGCIYLDGENHKDFNDRITFIFGHNVDPSLTFGEKTFFTTLDEYDTADFLNQHREILVYTPDHRTLKYTALETLMVPEVTPLYQTKFANDADYAEYLKTLKQKLGDIGNVLNEKSKILILSTCRRAETNSTERRLLIAYREENPKPEEKPASSEQPANTDRTENGNAPDSGK